MFGADVVVVEIAGLLDGVFDDLFGPGRLGQLAHGHHVGPGLDDLLDLQANLAQVDVEVFQDIGGDAGALLDQAKEDVFGADVLVVEALRLLVGELHHLAGPVGKAFIHSSRLRQSETDYGTHKRPQPMFGIAKELEGSKTVSVPPAAKRDERERLLRPHVSTAHVNADTPSKGLSVLTLQVAKKPRSWFF